MRPIQPAPRSVPAPRPPVPSFSATPDHRSAHNALNVNVNVNMRFIVPPLLKEHGCIT